MGGSAIQVLQKVSLLLKRIYIKGQVKIVIIIINNSMVQIKNKMIDTAKIQIKIVNKT